MSELAEKTFTDAEMKEVVSKLIAKIEKLKAENERLKKITNKAIMILKMPLTGKQNPEVELQGMCLGAISELKQALEGEEK